MIIGIFESQSYFELGISVCNVKKVKKMFLVSLWVLVWKDQNDEHGKILSFPLLPWKSLCFFVYFFSHPTYQLFTLSLKATRNVNNESRIEFIYQKNMSF